MSTGEFKGIIEIVDRGSASAKAVGEAVATTTSRFQGLTSVLGRTSGVLTQISIMSFVYNLIQRRIEHSTLAVAEATRRYEESLSRYGVTSQRTISAQQKLRMAQQDVVRAQNEGILNAIILGTQMGMLGVRTIELVSKLGMLTGATWAQNIADMLHTKTLTAKAAALALTTFGISVAAGAIAMYIAQAQTARIMESTPTLGGTVGGYGGIGGYGGVSISHRAEFTVRREEDIDRAYRQMSEEAKRELRRSEE